jgi:exportin-1
LASDDHLSTLVSETDAILVEVAKYDWPSAWPTFLSDCFGDLVGSRRLALNSLRLVRDLVGEMNEFAEHSLTSLRSFEMSQQLVADLPQLLDFVRGLLSDDDVELTRGCLVCLKRVVRHGGSGPDFIHEIITRFLPRQEFTVDAVGLLAEMIGFAGLPDEYVVQILDEVVTCLHAAIGDNFMMITEFSEDRLFQGDFVGALVCFFRGNWSTVPSLDPALVNQLFRWMYMLSVASDEDTFIATIEFWDHIFYAVRMDSRTGRQNPIEPLLMEYVRNVTEVLIERMPRPMYTVQYSEEDGILRKRLFDEVQYGTPFWSASSCIVNACYNDVPMVLSLIDNRLEELRSIPSVESACSLAWAIGSLGRGDMQDASECLPKFLKTLFELCGSLEDLEDRAKIAAGISFVCSSFISFMQQHFEVMKSVITQLLSFSRETVGEIRSSPSRR